MYQIAPHIYQIGLGAVNAFIVEDKGLTLIDTGYKGSTRKIFSALEKNGKRPDSIKQIILTHCHPDHAGSAADIKNKLGIPLLAHGVDATLIEQGMGGRMPMLLSPGLVNWLVFNIFIKPNGSTIGPVAVDERLKENDVIPIAGGIHVIHTPGHSAGHVSLLIKNEGVLIAGDICANVSGLGLSTVYEDRDLGISSIHKVAVLDFEKAAFGHGRLLRKDANKRLREKFGAATGNSS